MPVRRRAPVPKGTPPATPRTRAQRLAIARGAPQPPEPTPPARPSGSVVRPSATPTTARPPRRGPQREPDSGFVAVGRVLAPFGLKGELKVQSLTENASRFAPGSVLHAGLERVTVKRSRQAQGFVYLTLAGHTGRTAVERFRHAILQVRESDLPPLPEGEFYRFQLIGLEVVDRAGTEIGVVHDVLETGANDVYAVRTPDGREVLLPATASVILSVDLAAGRMTVDPPDWR